MHPWHDITVDESRIAESFPTVIEVPKGSTNKYELDKPTGLLRLDRVLYSAVHYPADYGFVPRTYCEDDDPLDVLVLGQAPVHPLMIVQARAVGVMPMRDEKGLDRKLIAVSVADPALEGIVDLDQLAPHVPRQMRRFFEDYNVLEHERVDVESPLGRDAAVEVLPTALCYYTSQGSTASTP